MRLRAIALFVGITIQIALPLPGQQRGTADNSSDKAAQKRQGDKNAANPFINSPPFQPGDPDNKGQGAAPKDTEYSVKLTGSPVVTVADKNKTFWDYTFDWGPWVFNALLVGVGIAAVLVAHRTRVSIDRQADLMDRQAGLMATQAAVMGRQADLMDRQTALMEISNRQWLYLTNWNVKKARLDPDKLLVRVDLVNQSAFPMRLQTGGIEIGGDAVDIERNAFLPPNVPRQIELVMGTPEQAAKFDQGNLSLSVAAVFSHVDRITNKTISQPVYGHLECGHWGTFFRWQLHMNPIEGETVADEKKNEPEPN